MSRTGYSLIELVIASAIMLTVSGAVLGLVHDGLAGTPILEETTDVHQRARVVADAVAADLRAAAAGTPSGPLSRHFAAVEPRRPGRSAWNQHRALRSRCVTQCLAERTAGWCSRSTPACRSPSSTP